MDNIREMPHVPKAWKRFKENILYFSEVYQERKKLLNILIEKINKKIQDDTPGKLILYFVLFHEKLYSMDENKTGRICYP